MKLIGKLPREAFDRGGHRRSASGAGPPEGRIFQDRRQAICGRASRRRPRRDQGHRGQGSHLRGVCRGVRESPHRLRHQGARGHLQGHRLEDGRHGRSTPPSRTSIGCLSCCSTPGRVPTKSRACRWTTCGARAASTTSPSRRARPPAACGRCRSQGNQGLRVHGLPRYCGTPSSGSKVRTKEPGKGRMRVGFFVLTGVPRFTQHTADSPCSRERSFCIRGDAIAWPLVRPPP